MKVRNRYLLILAIVWSPCLLAGAASYAIILHPQLDHRQKLEALVASSRERYARAVEAAKEKDQSRLAGQVETLHNRVNEFVVSRTDASDLAFKIGELAQEAKLTSFGMRPANRTGAEAGPDLERVAEKHLDMTFSGEFRHFAAFLNTLERHHPVLFVETFAISRPIDKDSQPQANLQVAVLVEKAAEPAGASP
jgi:outer membrane murein-binding lipoprotein Lpp